MKPWIKKFALIAAAPIAIVTAAATAYAMTVQPVIIDLFPSGRQMSQVIQVQNTFQTQLPVELRAQTATFENGALKAAGGETDDLLIFPPQALIEPGRTQSFRVQYVGDPELAQSKHFYVTVAQLPVKLPEGQSAVQVLYNFQVIVSVGVPGAKPALQVTNATISTTGDGQPRVSLNLSNNSNTYGYLSAGSLKIVQRDAGGKEVYSRTFSPAEIQQEIGFGLVGAGQQREMLTPIVLPQAGGTLEAEFTPRRG
ncbi:fimbria/pilus periplasmic chaperone [Allosphingosinicella indica]|uniref:P pilus assembly protein, chaperone PapD n=1 Tax=Allosphingosinicella indica TaxID=941907 RepID=A0A1X7G6N9_9SPHN|nr:fimbria/pilus periplasmic chaperone [Allosphingosinicella indica]SMF64984.1 P pilus assembly protein, chaperone PapD [Allosphingosinicella indica]